ncbi:MAG: SUMF1/EgtB/PvdO family nonheme iron enzyme [Planctomycetota bacterium]|jgi:formylglycine-generating enzyme required for sulfatase activity
MKKLSAALVMSACFVIVSGCDKGSTPPTPSAAYAGPQKIRKRFTNSIGIKLVRIEPGSFVMGTSRTPLPDELTKPLSYPQREELMEKFPHGDPQKFAITIEHVRNGDFDEKPAHKVRISRPFYMGVYEVTNAQYEKFDPSHRALRGKNGFSKGDDEAVIFVSWHEAKAFCDWLSEKEGLPYRLPTEAEWEYACRAGTATHFWTGDSLPEVFHKNARRTSFNVPNDIASLTVGETPANPWSLYDMHGNVEEWCHDWYGPYKAGEQVDPVGMIKGDFKVTRGGSHGTNLYYLRSANRMGTLPENKHWLIGLRVVIGELPETKPSATPSPQRYQLKVKQEILPNFGEGPDPDMPYFRGPRRYVKIPKGSHGPLYWHHNHDPAIVECPNGDLLAIWYTCVEERGRELAVAASRLRCGQEQWESASPFWEAPDRNDHCPALWFDGKDTIYHFNGLCVAGKWEPLAIIMRTSKDNGVTWSKARLIAPEHGFRQMVGEPVFRTREGAICVGADAEHGSTIWVSRDNGKTWYDPGGKINGIHAGIVELSDGRLMALGRNQNIDGWMPKSISSDMGKTWQASASIFQPLTGGQRAALIRLKEGPLFFASFAKDIEKFEPTPDGVRPPRHISSIFGAVSFDDGETWPVRRVISDCKPDHPVDTIDNAPVLMNAHNSEPLAYLSVCQGPDGVIHLISSTNHYAFNLAWLKEPPPAAPKMPTARSLPVRKCLRMIYDGSRLPTTSDPPWHFVAARAEEKRIASVLNSDVLKISTGGESDVCWSNERLEGHGKIDAHKGLAAEVAVQVPSSSQTNQGFNFEVFVRGGTLTVNHYSLSITPSGLYYLYDKNFTEVAEGLDNSSAMHTYRLAVRDDTAVQIYRDDKLLGGQLADLMIGWREPARGSFLEWGGGAADTEALVDYIACDLSGPSQPE